MRSFYSTSCPQKSKDTKPLSFCQLDSLYAHTWHSSESRIWENEAEITGKIFGAFQPVATCDISYNLDFKRAVMREPQLGGRAMKKYFVYLKR